MARTSFVVIGAALIVIGLFAGCGGEGEGTPGDGDSGDNSDTSELSETPEDDTPDTDSEPALQDGDDDSDDTDSEMALQDGDDDSDDMAEVVDAADIEMLDTEGDEDADAEADAAAESETPESDTEAEADNEGGICPNDWEVRCNGVCTDLTTMQNCGECGHACEAGLNAIGVKCEDRRCVPICKEGFANCTGDPSVNDCATHIAIDLLNCGGCMQTCSSSWDSKLNMYYDCANLSCTTTFNSCQKNYGDCNHDLADGCETYTLDSAEHCGSCGNACKPDLVKHLSVTCRETKCEWTDCLPGYLDCDGAGANGCEIDHLIDVSQCGGRCTLEKGECIDTTNDTANCGGIGQVCTVGANASGVSCQDGHCVQQCKSSQWSDCDGLASNGCETNLWSISNCGGCGLVCTSSKPGYEANCIPGGPGLCLSFCNDPKRECNGECIYLMGEENCGGCGNKCSPTQRCVSFGQGAGHRCSPQQ